MHAEHSIQEAEVTPPRPSFPRPQGCHHNVGAFSNEWFDPALQYLGLEWSQSSILFHEDWLIQVLACGGLECHSPLFHRAITSHAWVLCHSAPPAQQTGCSDHSHQGVESLSISLSLIMLMILPSVQVPIMIGTCWENSDSSDTTRKTMSSS